ncbi:MAG: hypothetical protein IPK16_17555 [Anaerolineales bacterium]|nr:hypothetical protein [Anaerolineales bacterium]
MADATERIFRTKTGLCRVTQEQIVLEREGARRGGSWSLWHIDGRALVTYAVLGCIMVGVGIWMLFQGSTFPGLIFCFLGIYLFWNIFASRNNSATMVINRSSIRAVEAHPPHPPATRGYFNLFFDEQGKEQKRIIMLPGSLSGGQDEYRKAESILREAGLL